MPHATEQRITRSDDFNRVLRHGTHAGRGTLAVHLLLPAMTPHSRGSAADDVAPPRFGLIVPKPVGNAVARNRVARRLRHLMRPLLADLPLGALVVIRARPAAATAGPELGVDLVRALAGARGKADRGGSALVSS